MHFVTQGVDICQSSIGSVNVHDATAEEITSLLLSTFTDLQLNLKYLRDQGYDDAVATSVRERGVKALLRKE